MHLILSVSWLACHHFHCSASCTSLYWCFCCVLPNFPEFNMLSRVSYFPLHFSYIFIPCICKYILPLHFQYFHLLCSIAHICILRPWNYTTIIFICSKFCLGCHLPVVLILLSLVLIYPVSELWSDYMSVFGSVLTSFTLLFFVPGRCQ